MNFIEIVRSVREIVGMQGTGPTSVATAVGAEAVLVRLSREAYIDVQNLRPRFDFLDSKNSFSTVIGQTSYSIANVFPGGTGLPKEYDLGSFTIMKDGKKTFLRYIERDILEAAYMNSTVTKVPNAFSIDFADNSILLYPTADALYTVNFRYWREPEILTTDAQIPRLPIAFHMLIVYKAVEKMAIYLNTQASYSYYNNEAMRLQGQLMRSNLRPLRSRVGALA